MGQLEQIWSDARGRGPPDRGRPDGQQRLHPPLPPDGRRHAHRRRQRARGAARDLPAPRRAPGRRDARALGPHPGGARGARRRHLGGRDQRRRRHAAELRPDPRRRRDARRGRPAHHDPGHARATPPAPSASPSRAPTSSSPATRSSPAARGTPRSRAATSPPSSSRSTAGSSPRSAPTPWSCPATATPPPWATRPPTCRNGSTGAGEGRRNEVRRAAGGGLSAKPDQKGKLLAMPETAAAARDPRPARVRRGRRHPARRRPDRRGGRDPRPDGPQRRREVHAGRVPCWAIPPTP